MSIIEIEKRTITSINDLLPPDIKVICDIIEYELELDDDNSSLDLGLFKISGNYKKGAQGLAVAKYIASLSVFLIEYYGLDSVVYDLRELDYKWGNNLIEIIEPESFKLKDESWWFGNYIIFNKNNKGNIESLLDTFELKKNIMFESFENVKNAILEKAKKMS